jgi:hypothetical protein
MIFAADLRRIEGRYAGERVIQLIATAISTILANPYH